MKGVVFTEFLEMVEEVFSIEIADKIIEAADLPSGGSYTTIGTYDHDELIQLVTHLSQEVGESVPDLTTAFGGHLFQYFVNYHSNFFEEIPDLFEFLLNVEDYIHVEVKKLYPDAELPTFEYDTATPDQLTMRYSSRRPFADLAEGLLRAGVEHFGEPVKIDRTETNDERTATTFVIQRA